MACVPDISQKFVPAVVNLCHSNRACII